MRVRWIRKIRPRPPGPGYRYCLGACSIKLKGQTRKHINLKEAKPLGCRRRQASELKIREDENDNADDGNNKPGGESEKQFDTK